MAKKRRSPPAWLGSNGKALFKKLAADTDLVNDQNVESLQTLCRCWDNYRDAIADLKRDGLTVVTSTGNVRKHPAYDIAKTSMEGFVRLSKLLRLYEKLDDETGSGDLEMLD
jgi:P27 family predicted phage terminase small subunit